MMHGTPEEIIDALIDEWPSGLGAPLRQVRAAIVALRAELAHFRRVTALADTEQLASLRAERDEWERKYREAARVPGD